MKKLSMPAHHRTRFDLWYALSPRLIEFADAVGKQRFELNMPERLNEPRLDRHQLGPRGELAAGCWLGMPLEDVMRQMQRKQGKGTPDLGKNLGVRTRSQWRYELNVMDRDPSEFKYLLVTEVHFRGTLYHVMRGWLDGARCKEARVDDPGKKKVPGHFVPEEWLHDPIELRARVTAHFNRSTPEEDPAEMMRDIGRVAFGLRYDAHGRLIS